jgi:hypothetical protein
MALRGFWRGVVDRARQAHEVSRVFALEGGANTAALALAQYDREKGDWTLPRQGRFWAAVSQAHQMGRRGDDATIAVVDDGFDLSIPQLAAHGVAWKAPVGSSTAHGTTVALLIAAVAPQARLLLYPVSSGGRWEPAAVEEAILAAAASKADIVNLSFGERLELRSVDRRREFLRRFPATWRRATEWDRFYWALQCMGNAAGTRDFLMQVTGQLTQAVKKATKNGKLVVAAVGNRPEHLFIPAIHHEVIAVGFYRVRRYTDHIGHSVGAWEDPETAQSLFYDIGIVQPPGVLGSSFATPLVSGFSALMPNREDVFAYREVVRLGFLAETGQQYIRARAAREDTRDTLTERQHDVVQELFSKAVDAMPHRHIELGDDRRCPECVLFASGVCEEYGLWLLNTGDFVNAEVFLRAACSWDPGSDEAKSMLGYVFARRADEAKQRGDEYLMVKNLRQAIDLFEAAAAIDPGVPQYQTSLATLTRALSHPVDWLPGPEDLGDAPANMGGAKRGAFGKTQEEAQV